MRKPPQKDPFLPRPSHQAINPSLRGTYVIQNRLTGKRVRATGPSLNAILQELKWPRDTVISTQVSTRGSDVVLITAYESVRDTTWLDE